MEFRDYYEIMGLTRDATQDDIKRAYRKLARKYHPDVSDDEKSAEKFKQVGEAYAVLKDPEKRAAYDQLGQNWQAGQDFHPPPGWDEGFEFRGRGFDGDGYAGYGGAGSERFSDFFEDLFGRASQRGAGFGSQRGGGSFHMHGEDSHARITIDIEDSYNGAVRSITLHAPEVTDGGHVVTRDKTLKVKIPKGIRNGQKIRLAGQGGPGMGGGQAGDLFLEIDIRPDGKYKVEGADVYLTLPVAPWEAALGSKVTVPIPSGNVDLKIPANSKQGAKMRLKGKGLPGKEPGDFYVVLDVQLPPANTEAAKALYQKMAEEMPFNPRAGF